MSEGSDIPSTDAGLIGEEIDERLARVIYERVAESLLRSGTLTESDISDGRVAEKVLDIILDETVIFVPVIDHTDTLLKHARRHRRRKEFSCALLFYATFFEHTLNAWIREKLTNKGLPEAVAISVIKRADIEGKLTWALAISELPRIDEEHQRTVRMVAQLRNEFVHYKWGAAPESGIDYGILRRIDRALRYFARYEEHEIYGGNRRKLRKFFDNEKRDARPR